MLCLVQIPMLQRHSG